MARQVAQHLAHLGGQFARGHQHQGARAPRPGAGAGLLRLRQEPLQQRQAEGGRLARARLRAAQHVAPVQHGGNGLRLDGRGRVEAQGTGGVDEGGREAEGGKGHGGRGGQGAGAWKTQRPWNNNGKTRGSAGALPADCAAPPHAPDNRAMPSPAATSASAPAAGLHRSLPCA